MQAPWARVYLDGPVDGLGDLAGHDEEGRCGQHGCNQDAHAEPLPQQHLLVPASLVEQPAGVPIFFEISFILVT